MDNQILNSYSKISKLNVSRETCNELESLISMIQEKNREINLISREIFQNTLKDWDLDYSEKKSITSEESFLVNVKKIKKKIKKN